MQRGQSTYDPYLHYKAVGVVIGAGVVVATGPVGLTAALALGAIYGAWVTE